MIDKLIIYLSPGHQCTEFVPWLINNSPDMDHGQECLFPDDWTEYQSSYGQGWEPMDSQWTFDNDSDLRMQYKQIRMQKKFSPEFMNDYVNHRDGNGCIFFNVASPTDYKQWVSDCRSWFADNFPDTEIKFAGHVMDLFAIKHPSLFFIKEGYILDEDGYYRDRLVEHSSIVFSYLQRKVNARFTVLHDIYKDCNFDYIFDLSDIEDVDKCRDMLYSIVTLPENFDELHAQYFKLNPIDPEVESMIESECTNNGIAL
ncbi:hypothetical protein N8072_01460 [bacterium]|nr:hypothetical protein [bacterium]MDB4128594.1 hypothetical protein [bacterium]MDC1257321.1 hypothetical protein [bacterium]